MVGRRKGENAPDALPKTWQGNDGQRNRPIPLTHISLTKFLYQDHRSSYPEGIVLLCGILFAPA
jgi:hypothetical protein